VLRFKNEEIESKIDWVIKVINRSLKNSKPHSNLSLMGNGSIKSLSPLGETGKGVKNNQRD
jgi:hypothetical protein